VKASTLTFPKISVIIPTHNRAHLVCETIDSVLTQTYTNYEIIVVDDGSTDNTKEVLERYGKKIRYFYQENQGQATASNYAVRQSKGDYLAFIDDDDLWLPEKLEQQVKVLEKYPDLHLVCSDCYALRENGNLVRWNKKKTKEDTFQSIFDGNFIIHPTVMLRKKCFEDVGGYDTRLRTTIDYDLWLRLIRKYKFRHMSIPLTKYRLHSQNMHKNIKQKLKDHLYIFSKEENVSHLNFIQKRIKIAREYHDFIMDYVKREKYFGAANCCFQSIIRYPFVGSYYGKRGNNAFRRSLLCRIIIVYGKMFYYFFRAIGFVAKAK